MIIVKEKKSVPHTEDSEKENKIEILANIIFNAAKHGYMPYDTQDEYCAMEIAKKNIDKFIVPKKQEEPVSEALEGAAQEYVTKEGYLAGLHYNSMVRSFKAGAQWQKNHLWKHADGDDLPEINREIVAFQEIDVPSLFKIVIAHRPNPEGYDGKSIATGEVEHYTPKTYDKGGWNIPDIVYWLDVELPKE